MKLKDEIVRGFKVAMGGLLTLLVMWGIPIGMLALWQLIGGN